MIHAEQDALTQYKDVSKYQYINMHTGFDEFYDEFYFFLFGVE
jgi:hypothetical protein